ncbi:Hypothetical predicted protein [Olea europaea subsp. europaea]|uniref:Uncharacterized protein n=1 Tax=Olea europaea subsp. europaea TaxID=158383 RepID=A0A8S0SGH7_OLEEU|nr:Hypothetical predicted protein [Olea europaea subsp. europaea]
MVNRYVKGNKSKRSEKEKASLDRLTSPQNSVKDALVATEMDMSLNEFSNSFVSQDSVDTSKEDQPRITKGGESFFPNNEEFDYPMPENCAAGNTGDFVNGRELHQKDLDLLSSRGLPNTRNRSYVVKISGKVMDEHTGEKLDGLGKRAPT